MLAKTKIIEIDGARYQIRRMAADVGSFLSLQLLGAAVKGGQIGGEPAQSEASPRNGEATSPEAARMSESDAEGLVRGVASAAFLRGLDFQSYQFVQQKALEVCSRMEEHDGSELPMPILSQSGTWAIPEIRSDMPLVMRLEMESLAFNCSPFFSAGGLQALTGAAVPRT